MKSFLISSLFLATLLLFGGCSKDYKAADEAAIQQYIQDNNLTAVAAQDGLYYVIDVEGTGAQPTSVFRKVTVHYTGKFLDGSTFETSTNGNPIEFQLSGVIQGWQLGIPYFKEGGSGSLLIPSHLAYGSQGAGSIPPNTPLVFDIQLISVEN